MVDFKILDTFYKKTTIRLQEATISLFTRYLSSQSMAINRITMKSSMPVTEGRLLVGVILALYVLLSYARFHYSSETYFPLFSAALNENLLEDDIFIRDHLFFHTARVFFAGLRLLGEALPGIPIIGAMFLLFLLTNIFSIYSAFVLGKHFGTRTYALFLCVILFSAFEYLRGADVSVIYNHPFSPTAVAFPFAIYSLVSFFRARYLWSILAVFVTGALNLKLGFAVGLPIAGVMVFLFLRESGKRRDLLRAGLIGLPFFIGFAWYVALGRSDISDCPELLDVMIKREGNESDVLLNVGWIQGGRTYYYFLINAMAFYYCLKNKDQELWRVVFYLLVVSNVFLLCGAGVSLLSTKASVGRELLMLPWPKLAVVPTLLSLIVVCKMVIDSPTREYSVRGRLGCTLLFGGIFLALLNVDLIGDQHFGLRMVLVVSVLVVAGVYCSGHLCGKGNFSFSATTIVILFLASAQVAIATFNVRNIWNEGRSRAWDSTLIRPPGSFDSSEWAAAKWLNSKELTAGLAVYPTLRTNPIKFNSWRRYSTVPMYVTGSVTDYYGSCELKAEMERRRRVVSNWQVLDDASGIHEENVKWIILEKIDLPHLRDKSLQQVYENQRFVILEL